MEQLDRFGFPKDYAAKCLCCWLAWLLKAEACCREMGKHNHVTATYFLLVEKKKRCGGVLKAIKEWWLSCVASGL